MPSEQKDLYLTFDDGPVPGPTEFVLDLLERNSISATFFCIGDNIRKHHGLFSKVVSAGHTVGNHTVNHLNGWKTPAQDYFENVQNFDAIAGQQPATVLFRPPYGRITGSQIRMLTKYRIVMWDVLSHDFNHHLSPETCLKKTISACRPGSIIVFHDSYKAQRNMEYALPRLIDHFLNHGYRFLSIDK